MRRVLAAVALALALVAGDVYAARQADFSEFAGDWGRHGFGMIIHPDGQGQASWRIYQWCDQDPTPPCDRIENNEIHSGGQATFMLRRVEGRTAYGVIIASTDPATLEVGPFVFNLMPYGMAEIDQGFFPIDLCGPMFFELAPPDLLDEQPCGA